MMDWRQALGSTLAALLLVAGLWTGYGIFLLGMVAVFLVTWGARSS